MKCQNCQKRMEPDWNHCPACGTKFIFDDKQAINSPGAKYLPEAFTEEIYRIGLSVAEDHDFYRTFVRYVINVVTSPTQLVHFRAQIINDAHRAAGKLVEQHLLTVPWCALSLCTDRYFEESARIYDWSTKDEEDLKAGWYEMIARGFITTHADRRLDISILRQWSAKFVSLHEIKKGPFGACKLCTSKCQYQYDVSQIIDDVHVRKDFQSCASRDNVPVSESLAYYTRLLSERALSNGNLDFSYCSAVQLLSTYEPEGSGSTLSRDAQLVLAHKIRTRLDEMEKEAASTEIKNQVGIRAQVLEVIVRQAMAGAPWQDICAGPMQVNKITVEEVEAEIKRRKSK